MVVTEIPTSFRSVGKRSKAEQAEHKRKLIIAISNLIHRFRFRRRQYAQDRRQCFARRGQAQGREPKEVRRSISTKEPPK